MAGGLTVNNDDSYLERTRQPLYSAAFVLPILVVYEVGMLVIGPQAMRNGADVWLRQLLRGIGFGQYLLLPLLTLGILLAWQYVSRRPWKLVPSVLVGMFFESCGWAVLLVILANVFGRTLAAIGAPLIAAETELGWLHRLVVYCGAGIYEELLFRLMLLPALIAVARLCKLKEVPSVVAAVVLASLFFSLAHYRLFTGFGDPFDWYSFSFRWFAGVAFSALFVTRGFGITAGTHTLYDIAVGLFLSG